MSEVRPWVNSYISVAQLRMVKSVEIIDCARLHSHVPPFFLEEEPDAEKVEEAVWSDIDRAFAQPMNRPGFAGGCFI